MGIVTESGKIPALFHPYTAEPSVECRSRDTQRFCQFFFGEQQFAFATGSMIVVRAIEILGNVHVFHPQFSVGKITESIHQTGLSQTDGLDFSARQHDTGSVSVQKLIVKRGTFVFDVYGRLFYLLALLFFSSFCCLFCTLVLHFASFTASLNTT